MRYYVGELNFTALRFLREASVHGLPGKSGKRQTLETRKVLAGKTRDSNFLQDPVGVRLKKSLQSGRSYCIMTLVVKKMVRCYRDGY